MKVNHHLALVKPKAFMNLPRLFFKWATPGLFLVYFCHLQTILQNKNCRLSGIRTRIVRVEGENADHVTTTTALSYPIYLTSKLVVKMRSRIRISKTGGNRTVVIPLTK